MNNHCVKSEFGYDFCPNAIFYLSLCIIAPSAIQTKPRFDPKTAAGFERLPQQMQVFVEAALREHSASFSNARLFTEAVIDLAQWGGVTVEEVTEKVNNRANAQDRDWVSFFIDAVEKLKKEDPDYRAREKTPEKKFPGRVVAHEKQNQVYGDCPVASEKTVCCNLKTIDAVTDCALGCNYCAIQTMFSNDNVQVDRNLAEKLRSLTFDPNRFYHVGTGQSSDSLLVGNKFGILDALTEFCHTHKNIFLEFKSKSSNTAWFEETHRKDATALPQNMFFSWSVNPQVFIDAEELHTAPLERRLAAAHKMIALGFKVGFHLHPIVHFAGWQNEYRVLCERLLSEFDAKNIVYVSLGSLTIPRSVRKKIRAGGFQTMVTKNLTAENPEGKLTYPAAIKEELFSTVYGFLKPWHSSVFFYLCMEEAKYWYSVFGDCYASNDDFESAMLEAMRGKIVVSR